MPNLPSSQLRVALATPMSFLAILAPAVGIYVVGVALPLMSARTEPDERRRRFTTVVVLPLLCMAVARAIYLLLVLPGD